MPIYFSSKRRRRAGFALIIVVLSLTLLTALTVFFLSNVGRERRGVDLYSRGGDARHLSDTAVNLVMGQINAATKEGRADAPVSWASQPGMIRTYGTDGNLSNAYKLYSWDNLIAASAFDPNAARELPDPAWSQRPSLFTDLNAPVNGVYPIADPTIATVTPDPLIDTSKTGQTGSPLVAGNTLPPWDFPEAFSVVKDTARGYYASTNLLPMPVKWLYVLQDGTWVAPTSATAGAASFADAAANQKPSDKNPIVGRIAFWTDDETSKVNVNTASEGSFWDTPKAATQDDLQFAANPPAKNEFQRISGHPATTSLSAVFPELRVNGLNRWAAGGSGVNTTHQSEMQSLLDLTPRINWTDPALTTALGGSQFGTWPLSSYTATYAPPRTNAYGSVAIGLDANRLYATPDDLWFQPGRTANAGFGKAPTPLAATQVAKRLFLYTANSRAPETTLFETPRISLWPITWPNASTVYYNTNGYYNKNGSLVATVRTTPPASTMTPNPVNLANNPWMSFQERLLAFDSTINTNGPNANPAVPPLPYYFQRQSPDSPTSDWTSIQRNQDLVGYLSREMRQPIPGAGNRLALDDAAHFGTSNGDWIALNCFDFSRSLINQYTYNQTSSGTGSTAGSDYLYAFTGVQTGSGLLDNFNGPHGEPNAYSVVPLHVPLNGTTYTTEGAFPSLKEACLVFYATARNPATPPPVDPTKPPTLTDPADPRNWTNLITFGSSGTYPNGTPAADKSQTTTMQAVMLLSFSGMSPGVYSARGTTYFSPTFWVKVTQKGGGSFKVNSTDINFPQAGTTGNVAQYGTFTAPAILGSSYMASMPASLMTMAGQPKIFKSRSTAGATWNTAGNWSLISEPIGTPIISGDQTTFSFTGTPIQIDIYAPSSSGNLDADPTGDPTLLISSQTINFNDWSGPLPIPIAPRWNVKQADVSKVKMPTLNFTPTAGSMDCVNGWQAEVVPVIQQLGQTAIPTPTVPLPPSVEQRLITNVPGGNSYDMPGNTSTGEPLVYAFRDTATTGETVPLLGDFYNRVRAYWHHGLMYAEGTTGTSTQLFPNGQPAVLVQAYQMVTPYDTAISMVPNPTDSVAGDARLLGRGSNPSTATSFVSIRAAVTDAVPGLTPPSVIRNDGMYQHATAKAQYHSLSTLAGTRFPTGYWVPYQFYDSTSPGAQGTEMGSYGSYSQGGGLLGSRSAGDAAVGVETNVTGKLYSSWDWTALPGNFTDGGYISRPDQDYQIMSPGGNAGTPMKVPFYNDSGGLTTTDFASSAPLTLNVFVPNRQVPSPIILGTLPSSMSVGWQTLNFCPNPAKTITGGIHPGVGKAAAPSANGVAYTAVPDHCLLDFFWMPVAEPYPISDQFSTAGKVNLNYAMMPFPYIQRKTAMDAVLKSVLMGASPTPSTNAAYAKYYKSYGLLNANGRLDTTQTRFPVDVNATLKAFDYKFSKGDIFRSTSQICDMFLYPNSAKGADQSPGTALVADATPDSANIVNWWKQHSLTADNVREDPYSAIYSRLTTRSNTFTVHWKVQSLKKRIGSDQTIWTENQDAMVSELRGSTLIERYIDPNATNLPDYATNQSAPPLSQFYKWRVVSENYFRP